MVLNQPNENKFFLTGFRGSGKTTLAKLLAEKLNLELIEMDKLIVKRAGKSIAEITKDGKDWHNFRVLESEILKELIGKEKFVAATGGGLFVNDVKISNEITFGEYNYNLVKDIPGKLIIFLKVGEKELRERLKRGELENYNKEWRPALNKNENDFDENIKIYRQRLPLYGSRSDFIIDTSEQSPKDSLKEILELLKSKSKIKICLIIGDPIEHSLSPLMHNAGYKALGIDDEFIFLAARVKLQDVKHLVKTVKAMGIRGLTCTMPHKVAVMKYLDEIDKVAREIGAVNTVVQDGGILKGYNTDWLGALKPIERTTKIKGKRIGIIGVGGAARAIIYGLKKKRGSIKIFNKNIKQAKDLARKFDCEFGGFDELKELKDFDIIINATPLGMKPYENISPVPKEIFSPNQIVMDAVYIPYKTKMLRESEKMGAKIIPGIEMFLQQGIHQFTYYTKRKAPIAAMRKALMDYLKSDFSKTKVFNFKENKLI